MLYALPASQRQLMTLILRKLLASSTYAISSTLDGLAGKLETAAAASEAVEALPDELPDNLEEFDEDINTTAPQDKPSVWKMPAPVFRKTSGRLPKDFERLVGEVDVVSEPDDSSNSVASYSEPKPKSHTLKIVVLVLALAAMIAFLVVFLTIVYFFFLRANGGD